jgi:hypothetical protein
MAGYLKITRLSSKTGTYDRTVTDYQVNYTVGGVTYAVAWDDARLEEFLRKKVPLSAAEAVEIMAQLERSGRATIGDVNIPETEASSMGMEMIPDDF